MHGVYLQGALIERRRRVFKPLKPRYCRPERIVPPFTDAILVGAASCKLAMRPWYDKRVIFAALPMLQLLLGKNKYLKITEAVLMAAAANDSIVGAAVLDWLLCYDSEIPITEAVLRAAEANKEYTAGFDSVFQIHSARICKVETPTALSDETVTPTLRKSIADIRAQQSEMTITWEEDWKPELISEPMGEIW
jgi:hypothetical protein